jgi:hypothetical protein
MKITISTIVSQIYLLPTIKVTHNRWLNGDLEIIFGLLKWELVIGF